MKTGGPTLNKENRGPPGDSYCPGAPGSQQRGTDRRPESLLVQIDLLWIGARRVLFDFVGDDPVVLGAGDAVGGVEAGQNKFDARRAHRFAFGGVDLERLFPRRRDAFHALGVVRRRQERNPPLPSLDAVCYAGPMLCYPE